MLDLNKLNVFKLLSRAYKKLSAVASWENSKRASVEAQLRKIEVNTLSNLLKWA